MPKKAGEEKLNIKIAPDRRCEYCGNNYPADSGVKASGNGVTVTACSWRHLHKWLVDIFTTGRQIEMGMEESKPATGKNQTMARAGHNKW